MITLREALDGGDPAGAGLRPIALREALDGGDPAGAGLRPIALREALDGGDPAGAGLRMIALPGFDEFLLGYKDRDLVLDPAHAQAIVPGGNGIFRRTLVRSGRVVGTWRRVVSRGRLDLDVTGLRPLDRDDRAAAERELAGFARFSELSLGRIRWF
jgi:hypothetical protein